MARPLRWWIVAPLGACTAIAIGYLPPRAMPLLGQRFFRDLQTFEPPTPYRRRVQELANRYRATSSELRLREFREAMRLELERRRALELPGPAVLFVGPDSLSDSARGLVHALLDSAWSQLGLGVSKISVGLVLRVGFERPRSAESPGHELLFNTYLLPDSTDRTTCIAFLPIIYWGRPGPLMAANPVPSAALAEQIRNGLGTCGYFAAFGTPGHAIGRWLASRQYVLAQYPWGLAASRDSFPSTFGLNRNSPWFWSFVYRFRPGAVGCMAGRDDACRRIVGASGTGDPESHAVAAERLVWQPPSLAGAERYLADVLDQIGTERFGRFWNSELPVDTALSAALREPVGKWTRRWQATIVPPIRLGPSVSFGTTLLATLLGIVAVLLVALTASRRQVR